MTKATKKKKLKKAKDLPSFSVETKQKTTACRKPEKSPPMNPPKTNRLPVPMPKFLISRKQKSKTKKKATLPEVAYFRFIIDLPT